MSKTLKLPLVNERPANCVTLEEADIYFKSEAIAKVWREQGRADFAEYLQHVSCNDVRKVFLVEPICQLRAAEKNRGKGDHLYALVALEAALFAAFGSVKARVQAEAATEAADKA